MKHQVISMKNDRTSLNDVICDMLATHVSLVSKILYVILFYLFFRLFH